MKFPSRVLIIDEDKGIRNLLRASLSSQEYAIEGAATGRDGLHKAAVNPPEVFLIELSLPDMDGLQVIRRLRKWTAMPIIVISEREKETDKVEALEIGPDDYVTKPFGVPELLARIRLALHYANKLQRSDNQRVIKTVKRPPPGLDRR